MSPSFPRLLVGSLAIFGLGALAFGGCGSSGSGTPGSGGAVASGGASASGGNTASGTGGTTATGSGGSGGAPSTGSGGGVATGSGGTTTSGGVAATGGRNAGGGAPGGGGHGMTASGGRNGGARPGSGGNGSGGTTGGGGSPAGTGGTTTGAGGASPTAGCGMAAPASMRYSIDVGGMTREYILSVPSNYDANHPYVLIFAWHPWGGSAMQVAGTGSSGYYGLKGTSNNQAILVAPEGLDFGGNGLGWGNTNGEDIAFLNAMLALFKSQMCIDQSRIFSAGFSFGGMMSNAVGCAGLARAIAPMAGNSTVSGCLAGTQPVAYMGFHGTHDSVVDISGGRTARDVFVKRNGCSGDTTPASPSWCDGIDAKYQPCTCVDYQGCMPGYPVTWCEYNADHQAAPNSGPTLWKFFTQFCRAGRRAPRSAARRQRGFPGARDQHERRQPELRRAGRGDLPATRFPSRAVLRRSQPLLRRAGRAGGGMGGQAARRGRCSGGLRGDLAAQLPHVRGGVPGVIAHRRDRRTAGRAAHRTGGQGAADRRARGRASHDAGARRSAR